MYVPNYIPEPLEVPENIAAAAYPERLSFIRQVALMHLGSIGVIAALMLLSFPHPGLVMSLIALAICLTALDLVRIAIRGKPSEAKVSALCIPAILVLVAWALRETYLDGWPVFEIGIGAGCVVAYSQLSGRDFSFVGCCFFSAVISTIAVAAILSAYDFSRRQAAFALGANIVFVVYLVYDLASLLARRRKGEELAAVVDLYRDVFNFFGYAVRMVKHWQKHRIWTK